jgi:peptide/nickel transport system ATP-binding protein
MSSQQSDHATIDVKDLVVRNDELLAVRGISFTVRRGERLGIVGESGAGKSMTALALMGLLPSGWRAEGSIRHDGVDLVGLNDQQFSSRRGRTLSMIFQDPLTALNPTARIGSQIAGVLVRHQKLPKQAALDKAQELMDQMQLPRPKQMLRAYPHELSGGQRQRIMIAMALACYPQLVIADEPTTALDATVQKRVLQLLDLAVEQRGTSLIMITHNLAVVAAMCHRVIVMYGGRIVEQGPVAEVLSRPRHPYTSALLKCQPTLDNVSFEQEAFLPSIPGQVPGLAEIPDGCAFRNRCEFATEQCAVLPALEGDQHAAACWRPIGCGDAPPATSSDGARP